MIYAKGLNKSYGPHHVLKDLSMHVEKGEIYGFIGKNGAGKSTAMNLFAGLAEFQSGECLIAGKATSMHSRKSGKVGYLPENPGFYQYMTGLEYLLFIDSMFKRKNSAAQTNAAELLETVKLSDDAYRRIGGYSRGMRQRLGLASVLVGDPELLILDEPSSALDPEGRNDMVNIIKDLNRQGKTILISSHILDDIEKICNRIGILHGGHIHLETDLTDLDDKYLPPSYQAVFEKDPSPENIATLKREPWMANMETENGHFIFHLKQTDESKLLMLKKLGEMNLAVQSLFRKKSTLEDFFLRMVNKNE
ncbi:MAG TPA: ABC transporter ATP-binding protein [Clostridia bacterium]|nr:ABC transporter ATP-binding protein [Clostridia bacterium]